MNKGTFTASTSADKTYTANRTFFQPKLTVNKPNDVYEQEADAMADKIMRMPEPLINNHLFFKPGISSIQRKCTHCEQEEKQQLQRKGTNDIKAAQDSEPDSYAGSLSNGGQPLSKEDRNFFEPKFGYDFSKVRLHTDSIAAKSAQSVNALAYTTGNDIVFNKGQYSPETDSGKRLLVHELTHVVQQQDTLSGQKKIQRDEMDVDLVPLPADEVLELHNRGIDLPVTGEPPPLRQQKFHRNTGRWNSQTVGRKPRRVSTKRSPGFTGDTSGTYIAHIDVQIHARGVSIATLTWANTGNSPGFYLPPSLNVSPGAGNCSSDCSDVAQSQVSGSHCTPLSPPNYTVQGFADNLSGDSRASFVTWYHIDRGIAFHNYAVPPYPASHGCTRLDESDSSAEWIYDNSLAGITTVTINRDPAEGQGDYCWNKGSWTHRSKEVK